jgi:hypothetical protein
MDNSLINFYELEDVKVLKQQFHNPNYENHKINLCFRMLIVSYSGGGKSNILLNLLKQFDSTFNKILLVCKNDDEPLYNFLKTKIDDDCLEIIEGIEKFNIINFNTKYKKTEQVLVIFDDMINEKDQTQIKKLYTNGRKLAGGICMVYLAQSYYGVPSFIRTNTTHIIIKKLNGFRSIKMMLKDYNLCSVDQMINMYKAVMDYRRDAKDNGLLNMLLIDIGAPASECFRIDFTNRYLDPLEFDNEI